MLECLKNVANIKKSYKLRHESHENWKVELTIGGQTLSEVKIQRDIFHGDSLSPLLFVMARMPHNCILGKYTEGYKFTKSQEKINQIKYRNDTEIFAIKEKELETLMQTIRIYSQDTGM